MDMNEVVSDVSVDVSLSITSYARDEKGNRITGDDGKPIVAWAEKDVPVSISYDGCTFGRIVELATSSVKIIIQRSRTMTRDEFLEMVNEPFMVRDIAKHAPIKKMTVDDVIATIKTPEDMERFIQKAKDRMKELK